MRYIKRYRDKEAEAEREESSGRKRKKKRKNNERECVCVRARVRDRQTDAHRQRLVVYVTFVCWNGYHGRVGKHWRQRNPIEPSVFGRNLRCQPIRGVSTREECH
jgi:hypothetical protein